MAEQFLKELEASGLREPAELRPRVIQWVEELFPGVESVTAETLQQWMEGKPGELLLLDTRTAAEFEVSHLPGAILVRPEAEALPELLRAWPAQEHPEEAYLCGPVVCYCTVGYRSSVAAQLLSSSLPREASQGRPASPKIYNLRGGLVLWAAQGRRMVDRQDTPTPRVHPYSPTWAKLLEPQFRTQSHRGAV